MSNQNPITQRVLDVGTKERVNHKGQNAEGPVHQEALNGMLTEICMIMDEFHKRLIALEDAIGHKYVDGMIAADKKAAKAKKEKRS